jgi:apolipoprotein N-acyltransferase
VRDVAIAILGAALMFLASPPRGIWLVGVVAWVPLAVLASSGRVARAGLLGCLQGAVAQLLVVPDLPQALRTAGATTPVASFAFAVLWAVWEGGRGGVVAALGARCVRNGWALVVAFPAALVAGELLYPMFFPWSTHLFVQGAPALLQGAELGGPLLITFALGATAASIASAVRRGSRARAVLRDALAVPAFVLVGMALWGKARMRAVERRTEDSPALRVGLVHGGPREDRSDPEGASRAYRAESLDVARRGAVDLLVWPEAAIPTPTAEPEIARVLGERVFGAPGEEATLDVPVLAGVVVRRARDRSSASAAPRFEHWRDPDPVFNSAVLALPDGQIAGRYDKRVLVAFGEYLPGEDALPWLRGWLPGAGHITEGGPAVPLALGDRRVGVLICLEDTLGGRVRSDMASGSPELLVSLASDGWFASSHVPWLHLALARLRAIEHRRFLVRSTDVGVSAVISPSGVVDAELSPDRAGSLVSTVRWMSGRTPYARFGDAPFYAAVAAVALFAVRQRHARRTDVPVPSPRKGESHVGQVDVV